MTIGVTGPFNPFFLKEYFDNKITVPNVNITATSVNIYVKKVPHLAYPVYIVKIGKTPRRELKKG